MKTHHSWLATLFLMSACQWASGCSNGQGGACAPNRTLSCACEDGGQGVQTCLPDGSGFSNCSCNGNGCTSSEKCTSDAAGQPSICRADGQCVQLTSEDCKKVVGDYSEPGAVIFGFLGPLEGADASIGVPMSQATMLALEEITNTVVGPPGGVDSASHSLAIVYCHDLDGPAGDPWRAAKHLVNDVQVPAIIGSAYSGITIGEAKEVAIPGGTLMMSPSATSPVLTDLQDEGLVWRTSTSDALQASPLAQLASSLEAQVRAEQGLMASDQIRVAVMASGNAYGAGLRDALTGVLVYNGKSAFDNADNLLLLDYEDPNEVQVDFSAFVGLVVDFAPHIVVALGTTEVATGVFEGVEAAWPTTGAAPPRPYYLFPDAVHVSELLAAIGSDDDRRARVRGTAPTLAGPNYEEFRARYMASFQEEPLVFAASAYDATYVLAYAVTASLEPITGAGMAAGLSQTVPPGMVIDVGPSTLEAGFSALLAGNNIDLVGASGSLDFDLATGEPTAEDIDVWCVGRDADGQPVFQSSGVLYDGPQGALIGTYDCP